MLNFFNYSFMVNALLVGVLIAICCALLGVVLVLKRFSMIGDGLSHVSFGALSVAAVLNISMPLYFALPVVMVAAFFLLRLTENSKINADAAIAVISSSALAIGVFFASINGTNINLQQYMFGSILSITETDIAISIALSVVVILLYILFYNKVFAITFDEGFAYATGIRTKLYNTLISLLTAVTIVIGMRLLGTLLISAMIIFPALTSMRLCKRFFSVVIMSVLVSVVCVVSGLLTSFYCAEVPVSATIVIFNLIIFIVFLLTAQFKRLLAKNKSKK
ncbi:MAG: metal ABC transporter permease [Ruminococcaceae bacterium]|nr:metal ABC transporter permease [Oscillospiraceae bacterium]